MIKRKTITSEHQLQKSAVKMLRAHNFLCFHTDVFNGISFIKDIKSKAIYKQHMIDLGASVGQPDLIIIKDGKITFIEFKYGTGRLSPEQKIWRDRLIAEGYEYHLWRTIEECQKYIIEKLNSNIDKKKIQDSSI